MCGMGSFFADEGSKAAPIYTRRSRRTTPPARDAPALHWCRRDRCSDQRVGGKRAPLIGPQRLALPFRRPALGPGQPGARHRNLDRPERACQRSRAAAVAVARNPGPSFIAGHPASFEARPCQHSVELVAKQLFNKIGAIEPEPRSRSGQTNCRKDQQPYRLQAAKNQASCYRSSWRGLQSDASTPGDSTLITPETTPPSIPTNSATAPCAISCICLRLWNRPLSR
jgi:hypothetical protein